MSLQLGTQDYVPSMKPEGPEAIQIADTLRKPQLVYVAKQLLNLISFLRGGTLSISLLPSCCPAAQQRCSKSAKDFP